MSASPDPPCPFCSLPPDRVLAANAGALAILDAYPVSPGHTLILARRHVPDIFDLCEPEWSSLFALLREMKSRLDAVHHPDGYNVGANVGPAAGQTVPHVHIHLIPRYHGDVPDPTGGIRATLPGRAHYPPSP